MQNTEAYVYYGHGGPGRLIGTGNIIYASSISNLSNGSLSKVKLALYYACDGASSSQRPDNYAPISSLNMYKSRVIYGNTSQVL